MAARFSSWFYSRLYSLTRTSGMRLESIIVSVAPVSTSSVALEELGANFLPPPAAYMNPSSKSSSSMVNSIVPFVSPVSSAATSFVSLAFEAQHLLLRYLRVAPCT